MKRKWLSMALLVMLMVIQGMAVAESRLVLIPTSGTEIIGIWREMYKDTEQLAIAEDGMARFTEDMSEGRILFEQDQAMEIALEYIVIAYNVAYDELASFTPFVSYNAGEWQFDIVPPDAENAYAIYVNPASGEVSNAYYGMGEG